MDLVKLIDGALSDDLLKPQFRRKKEEHNRFFGHCYAASEAYYHLRGGGGAGLKPMRMRHAGVPHWWIDDNGRIVDITADQFVPLDCPPLDYSKGVGCGFLTKKPSKRAAEIMRRVKQLQGLVERFQDLGFSEPHEAVYAERCGDSLSRGLWYVPLYAELWVSPPGGVRQGSAVLQLQHQVLDRALWFRCAISIEEAKELVSQL